MEIPSENSGSFIIHRHPLTDASLEVMKNDGGYASISCETLIYRYQKQWTGKDRI